MNFKNLPKHVWWSVNGVPYAKFTDFLKQNQSLKTFDYQIICDRNVHSDSFREECLKAAKLLPDTHLAIPVSGSDSEIVARSAHAAGRKATIYYENYPWADPTYRDKSKKVADELGYDWVCFTADYDECLNRMKHYSVELGSMSRGFLISLGMFDKIPNDQFIVGGLGELEKDGWIYRTTIENCIGDDWDKEIIIPCPPTEIIWWLYGELTNRKGTWTFFNSTLPLIKSQATHPLLDYGKHNKGVCNTIAMKNAEWPELIFKAKTDHFHPSDEFYLDIYYKMEDNMYKHYPQELFSLVKKGFCGFVNYSSIFR
jgi:hypothetical protein